MAWNGYSEGGQGSEERGPSTFTFAPPGVPQQQGSQPIMAKMGYSTAQSVGGIAEYQTADEKTSKALFGFAETLLGPVAKDLAERKFLEGVQRAASGEALTSIVNEQPWYSKIFGQASAVEGARQYSLDAQAAKFDAEVQRRMPELRTTSPDELPGIIMEVGKQFETGDPVVDGQLGLRLVKVLPNLIQQHTREFYKAQQEQAYSKRFEAAQQNATSLQITSQNPLATEDDILLRQGQFLQGYMRSSGEDPESHKQFIYTSLESLAEAGQFHALAVALKAGVTKELPPERRLQLESRIASYRKQHAAAAREDYADQIDQLKFSAAYGVDGKPMSGQQVNDAVAAINEDYARRTGNTEPVVTAAQRSGLHMTAAQALMMANREALMAARAANAQADKLAAKQAEEQSAISAVKNSNTQAAINAGFSTADVNNAAMRIAHEIIGNDPGLQKPETVSKLAQFITADAVGEHVVPGLKSVIDTYVNLGVDSLTDNFRKGVELYRSMQTAHPTLRGVDNPAIAKYFSPRQLRVMQRYVAEVSSIPPGLDPKARAVREEAAYQLANSIPGGRARDFSKDEQATFDAIFTRDIRGNSWTGSDLSEQYAGNESGLLNKGWFGNPEPVPYAKQLVQQAAQAHYGELEGGGYSPEERMKIAVARAVADTEVYGKYAWPRANGRNTLVEALSVSPHAGEVPFSKVQIAQGLDDIMTERIRQVTDKDPENVMTVRLPDRGGDQHFRSIVMVDGETKVIEFSGEEVAIKAAQRRAKVPLGNLNRNPHMDAMRNRIMN